MMQITDLEQERKTAPLWQLGFRAFFLGGAVFSVITLSLWLLLYRGVINIQPLGGGYWWHIHEVIFGFGWAIIAGFLLTAVQTWTGQSGLQGKKLSALFSLWLLARIALIFPDLLGATLTTLIDLAFLPAVALVLAKPILAVKQYRN